MVHRGKRGRKSGWFEKKNQRRQMWCEAIREATPDKGKAELIAKYDYPRIGVECADVLTQSLCYVHPNLRKVEWFDTHRRGRLLRLKQYRNLWRQVFSGSGNT